LPPVKMIPKQLVHLFQILLENAFENVSGRPLIIEIGGFVTAGRLHLQVTDNGRGIKQVYLDKVFDVFKQTDQPSDRIGAGLAIAKEIVRKYGGEITAKSEFGKGSTFEFSLPIATT
jgi:signal transduction histidine kinase